MIKDFKPRLYQETIFASGVRKNTLVVLPTGLGKTNIFLMIAAQRLKMYPDSKILFIGPTRPLIDQYYNVFKKNFDISEEKLAVFTGYVKPEKRAELWKTAQVIFSTPQGLENDILSRRIDLKDVSLLGLDEAHKAVKEYSYVWVAKQYNQKAKYPRIIGLTASPGSDLEKISEVCQNLFIEEIEVRTNEDPDVKPYIKEIDLNWANVELPQEFKKIQYYIKSSFKSKLDALKKYGLVNSSQLNNYSKKDLLSLQKHLHSEMIRGNKDFEVLKSISLVAEALKVQHALELIESQGVTALKKYLDKMQTESRTTKVKAVQNLMKDMNIRSAIIKTDSLNEKGIEHPKINELCNIVKNEISDKDSKLIVFTQFRDSASKVVESLNEIEGVEARVFVGQQKRRGMGMSQKDQIQTLAEFRDGLFNVIVMTSVGEEGLDIPSVDLVVFYEPVPSAIRSIQRRGRTGGQDKGKVIVLVTKDTRDEAYRWSAHHKEKRMHRTLKSLKSRLNLAFKPSTDQKLQNFISEDNKYMIYVDYREKASKVIKELVELGHDINLEKLESADYILSARVGVEYKTKEDFVASLIDGRLLQQVKDLKTNFERPLILVEGSEDIYSVRQVHPNAINGMLSTITVSYGIPILYTRNPKETSQLLSTIAKKEQDETTKDFSLHGSKKPLSLKEQQEYIVSSLPNVGPSLAKDLLKNFKSVKKVLNAKNEKLQKLNMIGEKKANEIRKVLDEEYES